MLSIATIRPSAIPRPKERIVLLVDDHEATVSSLRKVVELAGYPCVATVSSSEAVRFCLSHMPRLVVTDLAMPRLDGHQLARWIKRRYPSVPILLITGELIDDLALAELEVTFTAVMSKPIAIERFLEQLAQLLPAPEGPACP